MTSQRIGTARNEYVFLCEWFKKYSDSTIMLVCGNSYSNLTISKYIEKYATEMNISIVIFKDFSPNPDYKSVEKAVSVFNHNKCVAIMAVGGGSAMDVAKCIKLYHTMGPDTCYLEQKVMANSMEIMAIPTTAGTGSEATRYAVIYHKGEKQSVTHESCVPQYVLFDASVLTTLNEYHRKASMLDALCHGIESFWSVHSTDESRKYSSEAIRIIKENIDGYLQNKHDNNERMMKAAYLAGKAINITQTTAGHAMSYKLTTLYGIAHGYAVALCTAYLWQHMIENSSKCTDSRGEQHLKKVFQQIAEALGYNDVDKACQAFLQFVEDMVENISMNKEDLNLLITSVNMVRLGNHPIKLEQEDIGIIYTRIMNREKK